MMSKDYSLLGGFLRLAFHDCVGKKCDGCINMNNDDNAGLDVYINKLEPVYQKQKVNGKLVMSRADFWALAGIEAVMMGSEFGVCPRCVPKYPTIKFQTGRVDCVGSPKGSPWTKDMHTFADPYGTTKQTTSFFRKQFGFGYMETVAIMGGHTLGQAHRDATGFTHPWVERKNQFNNDYYKDLVNPHKNWTQVSVGRPRFAKWQWESRGSDRTMMMLNSDVSLLKNLTDVSSGRVRGCKYNTCKTVSPSKANTAYWVKKFAKDNSLFLQEFGKAFQKVISHGYSSLKDVSS
ncbi:putative ascorbate peroxidase [Watersipora subatra]|uniref:putative ascorbate peroxidase n=1 Tax=Watersipora subatra TaxID=2589382 RepID=UPI00355B62A8